MRSLTMASSRIRSSDRADAWLHGVSAEAGAYPFYRSAPPPARGARKSGGGRSLGGAEKKLRAPDRRSQKRRCCSRRLYQGGCCIAEALLFERKTRSSQMAAGLDEVIGPRPISR